MELWRAREVAQLASDAIGTEVREREVATQAAGAPAFRVPGGRANLEAGRVGRPGVHFELDPGHQASVRADQALAGKLATRRPNVNLNDTPLMDAVKYAGDACGVAIEADWKALEAAGFKPAMKVSVTLSHPSAATLLWTVLLQAKADQGRQLGYRIVDGKVVVRPNGP